LDGPVCINIMHAASQPAADFPTACLQR